MADTERHSPDPEKHLDPSTGSTDPVVDVGDSELSEEKLAQLEELKGGHHISGRLVVDPEEARAEYGDEIAKRLKLSEDGKFVLHPQPTNSPDDPLNWSYRKKVITLVVVTLAAIIPDFDSSIGIASLFPLAEQYHSNVGHINNLTSNWSIFLLGWGGLFASMMVKRYGRLPVLFWSEVIGLGFLIGCTVAPTLQIFAAMRCLNAFFSTAPQVIGLHFVKDMFFFHQEAKMLNAWSFGFIVSPYLGPFLFGFLVQRQTWRWAYGLGTIYTGIVLFLTIFLVEETLFDRHLRPIPQRPTAGLRYRIETILGITGWKMRRHRPSLVKCFMDLVTVVFKPQMALAAAYMGIAFGWSIGINVTLVVFVESPPPFGYSFSGDALACLYLTPIIATLLGELMGHFANDLSANIYIKRHHGVFEPEARLWTLGPTLVLFLLPGMLALGGTLEHHLSVAGIVFGWGLYTLGVMLSISAVYAYCSDCFPTKQGEISAIINLVRTLCGFAVAYFQVTWAEKNGAMQAFGSEIAIVVGFFVLFIPFLILKGPALRARFPDS